MTRLLRSGSTRWPYLVGLLVLLLTGGPYLWAWMHESEQWAFTGFLFGVEDGLSYIAKMRAGAQGAWLFHTPYTTQDSRGVPVYGLYLALGHLLSPRAPFGAFVALYHWARILAVVALVAALARLLPWLLPGRPRAQAAAALWTLLGGGFGWLAYGLGWQPSLGWAPLSFYAPEAFGFLAVWGLPHLAAARAAWLYGWWAYTHHRWRQALAALLAVLVLQPLYLVPLLLLWTGTAWLQRGESAATKAHRVLLLGWLLSSLYWGWLLWARFTDPVIQAWEAQNNVRMVPPLALALAYGPWLPWVLYGARQWWQQHPRRARVVGLWLLTVAGLVWVPTSVQRRLLEGVWLIWGVLALEGAQRAGQGRGRLGRWVVYGPLALSAVSPALLLMMAWQAGQHPGEPLFRPRPEVVAMQTWGATVPLGAGVLAAYPSANALPAYAPVRTPNGHPVESPNWQAQRAQVAAFFAASTSEAQRRAWLRAWRVQWVWWGPRERSLGTWDPRRAPYLKTAFQAGPYWVLQVEP